MKKNWKRFAAIAFAAAGLLGITSAHADLILGGAPNAGEASVTDEKYRQLADFLSKQMGESVRYEAAMNFLDYAQKMREGRYDLLADGPHLAAWRMARLGHQPVVEASQKLVFLTLVQAGDTRVKGADDLINKQVCSQPSPNLATLMFLSQFPNPLRQPNMRFEEGFAPNVTSMLAGKCEAAVVNVAFYENMMAGDDKKKVRVVSDTRPLPGVVFTASARVSADKLSGLVRALSKPTEADRPLVLALGKASVRGAKHDALTWSPVNADSIKGLESLLSQLSWGW